MRYDAAMHLHRFGTFVGGIDLPDEKHATRDLEISPLTVPPVLRVPTDPCGLGSVVACVRAGQPVLSGDRIALAGGRMPIFAPLGGVVAEVGRCRLAGGADGLQDGPAVVIGELDAAAEDSPARDRLRAAEPIRDWQDAPPQALLQRIAEAGVTTYSEPLRPLADRCVAARDAGIDTLVADGIENQPYLTGEHRLLVECGREVAEGLAVLARVVGAEGAALAVDARRTGRYRPIDAAAERLDVQLLAMEHKYPIANPVMLTKVLTGRKVSPGRTPMAVGVAVVNVAACLAVHRCVVVGQRPTHRVVTVSGEGVGRPGNYMVPFGAAARWVLDAAEAPGDTGRFCHGGPMTGAPLPEQAVVSPSTSGLLSLPEAAGEVAGACIRCAWCTDYCPVRLNVADLNDVFELGQIGRAGRWGVTACLGCGVCSYVCPARLPLTFRMQQLKRAVQRAG